MKHTEGPWGSAETSRGHEIFNEKRDMLIARTDSIYTAGPVGAANANLIAAAPDLLEACRKTLFFFESIRAQPDDPLRAIQDSVHAPIRERLESAIAKAEGVTK